VIDIDRMISRSLLKFNSRWDEVAKYGWYPGENIGITIPKKVLLSPVSLDELMISKIDKVIDEIQLNVVDRYPHRKLIIDTAFKMHHQKEYIASIPLLFSQSEGVFEESFGKSVYSRRADRNGAINSVIEEQYGDAFNGFLRKIMVKNQFSAKSSVSEPSEKLYGPNRNGILHGEKCHLDYGTKINSYKCISLLSFLSWVSETYQEHVDEHNNTP